MRLRKLPGAALSCAISRRFCSVTEPPTEPTPQKPKETKACSRSHAIRMNLFLRNNPHIEKLKPLIPSKYFALKRITTPENLYLIDENVAKKVASYIWPRIRDNENQIVAETNAGLGLISNELLQNGVKVMRLYESCVEFREHLIRLNSLYKGRIEIFTKDIFLLHRYAFMDKQDRGSRVEQMLSGLPRKSWMDDPPMTIIGAMHNKYFLNYMTRSLILQSHLISFGRIDIFALMRPKDFVVLTAGPHLNLHTYQKVSVIFSTFYDYEMIDKFPRNVLLPWETEKKSKFKTRYASSIDPDKMYFVKIGLKKHLPLPIEDLLPFYTFVLHVFGNGNKRIVPEIERWVPGSGLDVMVPKQRHKDYFPELNIFTKCGELTPQQILNIFKEMIAHPGYQKSTFKAMVESQLIKSETIESALDQQLEKTITEDIEEKLS